MQEFNDGNAFLKHHMFENAKNKYVQAFETLQKLNAGEGKFEVKGVEMKVTNSRGSSM